MSTDPRPVEQPEAPDAPDAPDGAEPGGPEVPARRADDRTDRVTAGPRAGSGLAARLLTALYALVITPIATGLLSYGGAAWYRYYVSYGHLDTSPTEFLTTPMGLRVPLGVGLGLLLLASVVATGIASSAGLLVAGAWGLVSVAMAIAPGLLFAVYQYGPSALPPGIFDGLAYGLPLVLHPLLGGLGLALVLARRRPHAHIAVSLAGIVLIPVALLLAAVLLFRGLSEGLLRARIMFDAAIVPSVVVLVLVGTLLLVLAACATRWSPYALVIPALVMLAVSLVGLSPELLSFVPGVWSNQTGSTAATFLITGGGLGVAVVMLAHTAVLATVRWRARRRSRAIAPSAPTTAEGPGAASAA